MQIIQEDQLTSEVNWREIKIENIAIPAFTIIIISATTGAIGFSFFPSSDQKKLVLREYGRTFLYKWISSV